MASKLHIITVNVQRIRDKQNVIDSMNVLKIKKADIILVQETHFTDELLPYIRTEWKGESIHSLGTSQSRGVSIFISKNINAVLQPLM